MFRSDGVKSNQESYECVFKNLDNIKVEVISEIQKDLSPYDVRSLVFLLYDNPGTALERLIFLQRISKDNIVHGSNMELLCDWAVHAKLRMSWRHEFLEALTVCQLYRTIKKLGFDVESVKEHFSLTYVYQARYINPIKKVLYVLCENIEKDNFNKIKKSLLTYDINVDDYDSCELILLDLLKNKKISTGRPADVNNTGIKCNLKLLTNIVQSCKGVTHYAKILDKAENHINSGIKVIDDFKFLSRETPKTEFTITNMKEEMANGKNDKNVQDAFDMLKKLIEENLSLNLKADTKKQSVDIASPDFYEIKNSERVGLCYIINQESFYPSKYSIENKIVNEPLENRDGSSIDKELLKTTMTSLKFHVETSDNLIHSDIIPNIRKNIANNFQNDDSIFVLCILSHGVEGHVYGVDSVPVAVKQIEQLLDSEDAKKLRHKPKILIIQACQTNHDKEPFKLIADGPFKMKRKNKKMYLPKSDMMLLWATAPEFEAYRVGNKGSVFIFLLCYIILQNDTNRHFAEICTKLTHDVSDYIAQLHHAQLPICISTFRKNLYLKMPTSLR